MAKIKISTQEVKQMIKEEYHKKLTEIKLKNRLRQINEEIEEIVSEDMEEEGLEEVKAGGTEKVRSTAWTGEKSGDQKWKPQFEKKGSHLVEDEEVSDEEVSDEVIPDDDEEMLDMEEDLDIDAILAKLADAIEDKIESTVEEKLGGEETEEIPTDEIPAEEPIEGSEEGADEMPEETDEEIVNEQDGESIAQDQKPKNAVPFDNGKAEIPKTDQLVSEGTKKRMQILSGIRKNDFNE
jgi:hypothetical protein